MQACPGTACVRHGTGPAVMDISLHSNSPAVSFGAVNVPAGGLLSRAPWQKRSRCLMTFPGACPVPCHHASDVAHGDSGYVSANKPVRTVFLKRECSLRRAERTARTIWMGRWIRVPSFGRKALPGSTAYISLIMHERPRARLRVLPRHLPRLVRARCTEAGLWTKLVRQSGLTGLTLLTSGMSESTQSVPFGAPRRIAARLTALRPDVSPPHHFAHAREHQIDADYRMSA